MKRVTSLAPAALALLLGCHDPYGASVNTPTDPAAAVIPGTLTAPSNARTLALSETQIDVSWQDNTSRETGFEIHRSPTGVPGTFTLLATVGANVVTYSDAGLAPGAQYCYLVRAVRVAASAIVYSSFSNAACATAAPVAVVTFAYVFAGGAHTCVLTETGAAYCWGRGESGQLGVPSPPSTCMTDGGLFPCSMIPVPVGGGLSFVQLAGGSAHTCALTSDGSAYCWGNNANGRLGDNSTINRDAPVAVATGLKFASIDAGADHTCALTSDGVAWCWGRNNVGQLGDGTTIDRLVPSAVSGGISFKQITAGGFSIGFTCGLADNGDAYCWGLNDFGQLGFESSLPNPHQFPTPVSGGLTFDALTAGLGRHSCGITPSGAAWCWGANLYGALGNRSKKNSALPVPVSGGLTFIQVVAGGYLDHTCGLIANGAAYCWGDNELGQVGDGTTINRTTPVAVVGGLSFVSVDAGFRHSCGRASTGTVYCWGSNGAGQLGDNSNSHSKVPVKVFGQP